jgi:hypothetical protein
MISHHAPLQFVGTVILAMILSAIAIIFLAGKSDAQSFISVEDFWGGILVGFMIGYTGTSFFAHSLGDPNRLCAATGFPLK